MNPGMALLADKIATVFKERTGSLMPIIRHHDVAYKTIKEGREACKSFLTDKEIDECGYFVAKNEI